MHLLVEQQLELGSFWRPATGCFDRDSKHALRQFKSCRLTHHVLNTELDLAIKEDSMQTINSSSSNYCFERYLVSKGCLYLNLSAVSNYPIQVVYRWQHSVRYCWAHWCCCHQYSTILDWHYWMFSDYWSHALKVTNLEEHYFDYSDCFALKCYLGHLIVLH